MEEVQLLKDESEQVQFLTRLLSKVPFFNPIFPKAVMNDFGEMVNQKIDGIATMFGQLMKHCSIRLK